MSDYSTLHDAGKEMWNAVNSWWDSGCSGPDPRGPAPCTSYVYSYKSLSWIPLPPPPFQLFY